MQPSRHEQQQEQDQSGTKPLRFSMPTGRSSTHSRYVGLLSCRCRSYRTERCCVLGTSRAIEIEVLVAGNVGRCDLGYSHVLRSSGKFEIRMRTMRNRICLGFCLDFGCAALFFLPMKEKREEGFRRRILGYGVGSADFKNY